MELIPAYRQSARRWLSVHLTVGCHYFRHACGYLRSLHQMAPTGNTHSSWLLICRPRKDERLSWPGLLTCCRWFTRNSGHPSAASREWDGKFASQTPTFYHCAAPPTVICIIIDIISCYCYGMWSVWSIWTWQWMLTTAIYIFPEESYCSQESVRFLLKWRYISEQFEYDSLIHWWKCWGWMSCS